VLFQSVPDMQETLIKWAEHVFRNVFQTQFAAGAFTPAARVGTEHFFPMVVPVFRRLEKRTGNRRRRALFVNKISEMEMPRPTTFTIEAFQTILGRISEGETLKAICREDGMPDPKTFRRWVREYPERVRMYDQARLDGTDALADELIDIAWDTSNDTLVDAKDRPYANHEWIARSRLKSETIRFLLMKLNPRRYGERMPDVIAARELDQEQAQLARPEPVLSITRTIVDSDNRWRERAHELEEELARLKAQPAQITYDPGPLPRRMDSEVAERMVRLIKDYVRKDDQREPAAVLDEVMGVVERALEDKYGYPFEPVKVPATA
jgi:hypothetical protein